MSQLPSPPATPAHEAGPSGRLLLAGTGLAIALVLLWLTLQLLPGPGWP